MSARGNFLNDSDRLLLRWSDHPSSPSREESVQMLEACYSEAVIRCSLHVSEMTEVYLIGKTYREMGIVRSCREEGAEFIVTIGISSEPSGFSSGSNRDPGILLIDDYLTEEQEQQILLDLENELNCESRCTLAAARWLLNRSLGDGAAVLQRFFGWTGTFTPPKIQEWRAADYFGSVLHGEPSGTPGYIQ